MGLDKIAQIQINLSDVLFNLEMQNCEVLGYATVDQLLSDLRADLFSCENLKTMDSYVSWKQILSSSLRATSLTGFLLLGTSMLACDLIEIINNSTAFQSTKNQVLDCLPDLDVAYRSQLLESFQNLSPPVLAQYLESMIAQNGVCDGPNGGTDADADVDAH